MKHIIVTRFGIGIKREAALQRRLGIMRESLLPSLMGQTSPVHWLVVADSRAPASVVAGLEALQASGPTLTVKTVDPLAGDIGKGGLLRKPFLEEIASGDRIVLVSRIDDDDVVHREFSETVCRVMQGFVHAGDPFPIAATWALGLHVDVQESHMRGVRSPWSAQSQAVAIDLSAPGLFNIMGTHWNVGKKAAAQGGTVHVIEQGPRLWIWLRHSGSVVHEYTPEIRKRGTAPLPSEGLPEFGLDPARLRAAYDVPGVPGIELVDVDGERGNKSRLEAKYHCLIMLRVLEDRMRQPIEKGFHSMAELEATRKTLRSLYYSI